MSEFLTNSPFSEDCGNTLFLKFIILFQIFYNVIVMSNELTGCLQIACSQKIRYSQHIVFNDLYIFGLGIALMQVLQTINFTIKILPG